jgi:rhamnogalacturonyl hydrolase YesR
MPKFVAASLLCGAALVASPEPLPAPFAAPLATVAITNPADQARPDEIVRIALEDLGPAVAGVDPSALVARLDGRTIPSQTIDLDGDGKEDVLALLVQLPSAEAVTIHVTNEPAVAAAQAFPKRTQAELSTRLGGEWVDGIYENGAAFTNVTEVVFDGQLKDHNWFMRYEGPGWESDLVGYRLYLDHRNGIDVFGKKTSAMVLQDVGLEDYEQYHHDAPWGMDILKVGNALGFGGFGAWDGERAHRVSETVRTSARIVENGPVFSSFRIDYEGWSTPEGELDLSAVLGIGAGSYLTEANLTVGDRAVFDELRLVTGIPKHEGVEWLRGETDIPNEAWTYLAGYGAQSLAGDQLGLAIFVQKGRFGGFAEDEFNRLVRLKPRGDTASYRFGAVWQASAEEAADRDAFKAWLEATVARLNREARVSVDSPIRTAALSMHPPAEDPLVWTRALADSVVARRGNSLSFGQYNPEGAGDARWTYTTGLLAYALDRVGESVGDKTYQRWAADTISSFVQADGTVETYRPETFNIDQINSGKMLLRLWQQTGEERYRIAAEHLLEQLANHPKTSEGAFWHKKIYPHQVWLDGVYMGAPFYSEAGRLMNRSEWQDAMVHEFLIVEKHLRDPQTGLYFHGWDESKSMFWADSETGLSEEFWGRGLGWYAMAIVDVLDTLDPESEGAAELRRQLADLAEALIAVQDDETGVWWQILDQPGKPGNFLESSASSMFVYTLARGINQGYLDKKYAAAARRGYVGLVEQFFLLEADHSVTLTGVCEVAGLGFGRDGSYDYYMGTPIVQNDPKGLGPALLCGPEIERLKKVGQ